MAKTHIGLSALVCFACQKSPPPAPETQPTAQVIDRVDDLAFVALAADSFAKLSARDRVITYHLAQAALAGDVIYYDQHHVQHLTLRGILLDLLRHREAIGEPARGKIVAYVKRFWAQHGLYNPWTSEKTLPGFTFAELQQAVHAARGRGAKFGLANPGQIDALLGELKPLLFDPEVDRYALQKNPPKGVDLLAAAASNYYDGVTLADLKGFTERYPLNSRVAKLNGKLVEEVYRAGNAEVPPGRYAAELARVSEHLRAAQALATPDLAHVLSLLVRYLETGEAADFRAYNVAWVHYNGEIDAILGFIESYGDPRGIKAAWEGVVLVRDRERTAMMTALAQNAAYFELHMPWDDAFKRPDVKPPVANAFEAVMETGDGGPVSPVGINLPNAQDIRQNEGSKSFFLANIDAARNVLYSEAAIDEFSWSPEEAAEAHRCGKWAWPAVVAFHEVVGHGSGKVSPSLKGDPMDHLKEYGSTLEEARADLVALYHAHDPKTVEIGLLPDRACADEVVRGYVRTIVPILRRIPTGDVIEEDHLRGDHLIVGTLVEKGVAERRVRDGKTYFVVPDVTKARAVLGGLLAELMRIKATGDFAAIEKLVVRHATKLDTALRDEALARTRAVGIPAQAAFVSPQLTPIRDAQGNVVDVKLTPARDLIAYILDFAAAN